MKKIISIDIGSTYTKGALFSYTGNELELIARAGTETTVEKLSLGVEKVITELGGSDNSEIYFSSSAKGGLKVAAIGIVPDLTLKTAREAALSAGAKITDVFSYKLADDDIAKLKEGNPDIILFTGGTDGGVEDYNIHNAEKLSGARLACEIIYAGNKSLQKEIAEILKGEKLTLAENVLPELDEPNVESAREKIREIFLNNIAAGKGLDEVSKLAGSEPYPTPYAMYEFIKTIHKESPEFGEFCLIDMGGATTDFYSCCAEQNDSADTVKRGVPEPLCKRTVEGDLGLRISAEAAYESTADYIEMCLEKEEIEQQDFKNYLSSIAEDKSFIPETEACKKCDIILASGCVTAAAIRHAGVKKEVYTANGKVWLKKGKDLTGVKKIIGSGGFLSRMSNFTAAEYFSAGQSREEEINLLPADSEYYRDSEYIFPLLANIAFQYSKEAVILALELLSKED
ncbi:MAG: glutamate mutase L [Planctomycetota bacterium]|jgi:uncharacterized protein (TIGR01319 family)